MKRQQPAHTDIANAAFEWTPMLSLPHCCFASAQCVTGESQCFIIKSGSCGIILPNGRPVPGRAGLSCNAWWVRHADCIFGLGYFGFTMGSLRPLPPTVSQGTPVWSGLGVGPCSQRLTYANSFKQGLYYHHCVDRETEIQRGSVSLWPHHPELA